jgi:ABC-type glycerol-3-phosphate transport system permease component
MANLLDLIMLVLATLGALAFGILAAYAILRAGFALMRPPQRPALMKTQPQAARIS